MALDKVATIGSLAIGAIWAPAVAILFQIEGDLFKQIFTTLGIGGLMIIGGFLLIKHLFGQNGNLAKEKDELYEKRISDLQDRIEKLEKENEELRRLVADKRR